VVVDRQHLWGAARHLWSLNWGSHNMGAGPPKGPVLEVCASVRGVCLYGVFVMGYLRAVLGRFVPCL
jgi:hypothetical protein